MQEVRYIFFYWFSMFLQWNRTCFYIHFLKPYNEINKPLLFNCEIPSDFHWHYNANELQSQQLRSNYKKWCVPVCTFCLKQFVKPHIFTAFLSLDTSFWSVLADTSRFRKCLHFVLKCTRWPYIHLNKYAKTHYFIIFVCGYNVLFMNVFF